MKYVLFISVIVGVGYGISKVDAYVPSVNRFHPIDVRHPVADPVHQAVETCQVIINAMPRPMARRFGRFEYVGNWPITDVRIVGWPAIIPNSCDQANICRWYVTVKDCSAVRRSAYYVSEAAPVEIDDLRPAFGMGGPND